MDKRKEANLRVKQNITAALFSLIQEKSLTDIHVTEIIQKAGVARASFYRNYCSKEDVLVTLIRDVLEEFRTEIHYDHGNFYTYENILLSFQYIHRYRDYILDLYHSGFAATILEELNLFHESLEGTMPASSIRKYELYFYIGSLFNTAVIWLSDETEICTEDIATFFYHSVLKLFNKQISNQ